MWGAIASVAGPIIGGMISGDAAGDAAAIQGQATDRATEANAAASREAIAENRRQFDASQALLKTQYDQGRADLAPYRSVGTGALNNLAALLGIQPQQTAQAPQSNADADNYRAMIASLEQQRDANGGANADPVFNREIAATQAKLDALTTQQQQQAQTAPPPASMGAPGSLNDRFQAETFTPQKFTLADFWDDPVTKASYQSGLDLGEKAVKNMASARGGLNSGATLKALTRFGTDYTGQQAAGSQARFVNDQNNAYSRFTNDQNNAYNRFTNDQNTTFNRLSGLAGVGSNAVTSGNAAGQNYAGTVAGLGTGSANSIGNLLTGTAGANANLISSQGNARGAATIAGANALSGGINSVGNWFNNQQTLDKILNSQKTGNANLWSTLLTPSTNYGLS